MLAMTTAQSPHPPGPPHPGGHPGTRHESLVFHRIRSSQDRASDAVTGFAGSLPFVYLHAGWFLGWLLVNFGAFGAALVFDPFPFGLLTLIVSLEAIFLSTFVMISQNREAARAEIRAELDFETNVRAEIWAQAIATSVGVDRAAVEVLVEAALARARQQIAATRQHPAAG